jgi:chemotaxis protein CheZ
MAQDENLNLKTELAGLFHYIQRVRTEIAAIHHPAEEENNFESMSDQLDAIVEATEQATDTIMSTVETNEALSAEVRAGTEDTELQAKIDEISGNNMGLFEACSFQDITGQRITKVVRSLAYVEARVNKLIESWGRSKLENITVALEKKKSEDEKLLHGPQRQGDAISRGDIDALFD